MKKIIVCGEHLPYEGPIPNNELTYILRQYQYDFLLDHDLFPVILPSRLLTDNQYKELISDSCGLFLFGGQDVDPKRYGEDVTHEISRYEVRDEVEFAAIKIARLLDKPIFGICRGLQVINVALGGSLYQNLKQDIGTPLIHWQNLNKDVFRLTHNVDLLPGSILHEALGLLQLRTNTFHNQSIKELGDELITIGKTSDGVVEAIQHSREKILAIQWHPEILYKKDEISTKFIDWLCRDFFGA